MLRNIIIISIIVYFLPLNLVANNNQKEFCNINKKYTLEVNRDGDIFFPDIGPVYVAGLTFKDLKETLQKIISNQTDHFE